MDKEALLKAGEQSPTDHRPERRLYPRHLIDTEVQYRTEQMTYFEKGVIKNLSQQGMLLMPLRRLKLNTNVHIIVMPDQTAQQPIRITARVLDCSQHTGEGNDLYNCRIDQIDDPNFDDSVC